MTLAESRVVLAGETPHAHEREAIEYLKGLLPNNDPYHLWGLVDLLEPGTGRLYEIDLLVLGFSALYLIEVKSGPGRYEGDHQDWYRTEDDGRPRYLENPLRLTNHKAKVLASRLARAMPQRTRPPFVQPLIFLSNPSTRVDLRPEGRLCVVTRETILKAITHHEFNGAPSGWQARRVDAPTMRDVVQSAAAIGLRPRRGQVHVGAYVLGPVLGEGPGYQDREAKHRSLASQSRRARVYLVPDATSIERRQLLRRAADREAELLWDVREHGNILSLTDFEPEAPLGPTVLFDPFDGGVPVDVFLRKHPDLSFSERVQIVEQVGRALAYCHRKRIVHGSVSPQAVLVRGGGNAPIETRLFQFQLGGGEGVEPTSHLSQLATEGSSVYQAPEVRENPSQREPTADYFGLGALAYFVFTGRPPADNVVELTTRLARDRWLDPTIAKDGIADRVVALIRGATYHCAAERGLVSNGPPGAADTKLDVYETLDEWVDALLDAVTAPPVSHPEIDPLQAQKGDTLRSKDGVELRVLDLLGHGSTSRVLKVERVSDGRVFALKVPLSEEHHARMLAEEKILHELRHDRIVRLERKGLVVGAHPCLLLSLAGDETLHRLLSREGAVSLDDACRYGEDLLLALEYLERIGRMHRDIKPANLGVGSPSKGARHLVLFDFSLSDEPPEELRVGTAAYRDRFLPLRRVWDEHAERWSAAVTLYEMLTGTRPLFSNASPLSDESRPVLTPERFDASVRDRLTKFFDAALATKVAERFQNTEDMRRSWLRVFDAPAEAPRAATAATVTTPPPALDVAQLQTIEPETVIEALPLSARAKNALDRAGLQRAVDLLQLADNRLSVIRGIGSTVAREILEFRNQWRHARKDVVPEAPPFFAGFEGDDIPIAQSGLPPAVEEALLDAGVTSLRALAATPEPAVRRIAEQGNFVPAILTRCLQKENERASELAHPTTLERWIEALLPQKPNVRFARLLYGLEAPFVGRIDVRSRDVAEHGGVTGAAVSIALTKNRVKWAKHAAIGELVERVMGLLSAAGGAAPLKRIAADLVGQLASSSPEEMRIVQAAALIRIVVEVGKEGFVAPSLLRLRDGLFLTLSGAHEEAIRSLGAAADVLAKRDVLPASGETKSELALVVAETPLATMADDRLVEIAALASTGAACSARLEIYPRGLDPIRALRLAAPLLRAPVTLDRIREIVSSRYPEASPLPDRPALDALLVEHKLVFHEGRSQYERPGEVERTVLRTASGSSMTRLPHRPQTPSPEDFGADDFEDKLRIAVERHALRVLGVPIDKTQEATFALSRALGVSPTPIDQWLGKAMMVEMGRLGVRNDVVHRADSAEDVASSDWRRLCQLAERAAGAVASEILPPKKVLLAVQLGLCARYGLNAFLSSLVQAGQDPLVPAVFLVVPCTEQTEVLLDGHQPIVGALASQIIRVPRTWITRARPHAA